MRSWASAGIFGLAMSVAPVAAQPSTDQLSGRYYLSGVMETGSELLLRPDGSFEWAVTYGAVDAAATGHWSIDGRAIQAFQARLSAAQGLHAASGTHGPELAPLKLPAECQLPDPERLARTFRGAAIQLFDRDRYLRGEGICIEARYDKRAPISDVVERGYAFFPVADDERIVGLTLSAPGTQVGKGTTLSVSLPAGVVQIIDADLAGTVTPPFQEIVLPVGADRSLGAQALFRRGAYRKAVDASSDSGHRNLR